MKAIQPPRFATWLLAHFGCSANNEAVLGDLVERYQRTPRPLWYWQQVLLAIPASFFKEIWVHKIVAVMTLTVGWFATSGTLMLGDYEFSRPHSWIMHAYLSPPLRLVLLCVIAVACAANAWIVGCVSGSNKRPMVLLYLAMELTAVPMVLRMGIPSWYFFTYWPQFQIRVWLTAFVAPLNLGLVQLGVISPASPFTPVACGTALMAAAILVGGGLFHAPNRSSAQRQRW